MYATVVDDVGFHHLVAVGLHDFGKAPSQQVVAHMPQVQRVLKKHACKCVTVFFKGDADVFYRRYIERDNKHLRHLGHILQDRYPPEEGDCIDYEMSRSEFADKFEKLGMADFKLDTPCINVDATYPEKIDVNALISQICNALI